MRTSFTWITKITLFVDENSWFSVTQSCSAFVCQFANRCICLCKNIMFRQIGSHVGAAVHFFGVASLLSESVHMYMYIFKTERLLQSFFLLDVEIKTCSNGDIWLWAQVSCLVRKHCAWSSAEFFSCLLNDIRFDFIHSIAFVVVF